MEPRKKICKFMGGCKSFLAGKDCGFSHQKCKFGTNCKKQGCFFYHDSSNNHESTSKSIGKKQFDKPREQTLCRFGAKCSKLKDGNCPFKHESNSAIQQFPQGLSYDKNGKCKFGSQCSRPNCKFEHDANDMGSGKPIQTSQIKENSNPFFRSNQQAPTQQKSQQQQVAQQLQSIQQRQSDEYKYFCQGFIHGACNQTAQTCNKAHKLTIKDNIKRIFLTTLPANPVIKHCHLYCHKGQSNNNSTNNDQPVYILQSENELYFTKLTSSDKILSNNNNSQYKSELVLDCMLDSSMGCQENIQSVFVMQQNSTGIHKEIIVYALRTSFKVYYPTDGIQITLDKSQDQIVGVVFISNTQTKQIIMLVGFENQGIKAYKFIEHSFKFEQITTFDKGKNIKLSFLKQSNIIYGEQIIYGGCWKGNLYLINSELEMKIVGIKDAINSNSPQNSDIIVSGYVVDSCAVMLAGGYPILLSIFNDVSSGLTKILSTDLFSLRCETVMTQKVNNNEYMSKIIQSKNHLLIVVNGIGIVVYKVGCFNQIQGILHYSTQVESISSDHKGNISLVEEVNQQGARSHQLILYKIKEN